MEVSAKKSHGESQVEERDTFWSGLVWYDLLWAGTGYQSRDGL